MKIHCAPGAIKEIATNANQRFVSLYGRGAGPHVVSVGAAIADEIHRLKLQPSQKAIDLLSIALSVIASDFSVQRRRSPDGWTRELSLSIAVKDPDMWNAHSKDIEHLLCFLTTDIWSIDFTSGGYDHKLENANDKQIFANDCITLLSGGADSLVGAIDLVEGGSCPLAVSQVVHGDAKKQGEFAKLIGGGLNHVQFNHNAKGDSAADRDQRARSIIFLTYGVLLGTTLEGYESGKRIPLYVCENGFISINPPLTDARIGSLSTRTTHPVFISRFQNLLDSIGLNFELRNPYQFMTKGEMFSGCKNQELLVSTASSSTSCSRFRRFGFQHCGACVPCLIRRAAFHRWNSPDGTDYKLKSISRKTRHDDVISMAMAIARIELDGVEDFIGTSLTSKLIAEKSQFQEVVMRGINEVKEFLQSMGAV